MTSAPARVLNLWGGPGSGKSTTASGLFYKMKLAGIKCELVQEYAKDKTYESAWGTLNDQWYITGKQQRRLRRLITEVDWVITDSPLPCGLMYVAPPFDATWFADAVWGLFNSFDNINVYLQRASQYQTYGRSQTEAEALAIDRRLAELGASFNLVVDANPDAADTIFDFLFTDVDRPESVA